MNKLTDFIKKHGSLFTAIIQENIIQVGLKGYQVDEVKYSRAPNFQNGVFVIKLSYFEDTLALRECDCKILLDAICSEKTIYVKVNDDGEYDEIVHII